MKRHRIGESPKAKKRKLLIIFSVTLILILIFVPGPNGLAKIIYKTYKEKQLSSQIEQLKIKAELIESKIAKGQNSEYLRKYLMDYYEMVPKDSSR